jgi:rhodanese-related sulfurtransferase
MNAQQLEQVKILLPQDYKDAIKNNDVQLIDVRTEREYNSGHIKSAINVDVFNRKAFVKYFKKLDQNKPVYLYCRSGNRSQTAAKLLVELSFKEIYDLKGGFNNWKNN